MIYLGSIMFFRREKYRFVLVMISFLAFYFSTIIAVVETSALTVRLSCGAGSAASFNHLLC